MTERGIVHKIEGDIVYLSCSSACESCGGSCVRGKEDQIIEVKNPQHFSLKSGDQVVYFVPALQAISAGFMVLIMPLILFILTYSACTLLLPAAPEAVKVGSGFLGVVLGFLLNFLLRQKKAQTYPEVVRVIQTQTETLPAQ